MKPTSSIFAAGITLVIASTPVRPVFVLGHSMSPTLSDHQLVFGSQDIRDLQRGDIVVVDTPEGPLVKRIVYIEGDKIPQYRWQEDWITPYTLREKRMLERKGVRRRTMAVPAECIFVIGDNGRKSYDSRDYGPLPLSAVRLRINGLPDARTHIPGSRFAPTFYARESP